MIVYLLGFIIGAASFALHKFTGDERFYIGIALALAIVILRFIIPWLWRLRYFYSGIGKIDRMTGEEFEDYLKLHFENLGYKARTTKISRDFGADLILENDCEKIAVQAKRYGTTVGIAAVQQAYAAAAYYDCDRSMVVTNSFFSAPAIKLAEKIGVDLWDRDTIVEQFGIK